MTVQNFAARAARVGMHEAVQTIDDRELHRSVERIDCVVRACAQSQQLRNRADVLDAALARLKALRKESRA